jgi:mannosylglycerate hydrolase
MQTLHVVSHTHWDREWYKTFQQFRLQLVHLVDNLLIILDGEPEYLHFMLDGQTIVLEDYLQVRMANLPRLQKYIQEKRILIGPWYILPDEFLVSPESLVRNLLIGKDICQLFGQRMMVGYIPDPFGHLSQLPQIFNGFHMDTACLWRGVPDGSPTLFTWQSPDGSSVLLAHLYDGYGNIADWPATDLDQSVYSLNAKADKILPHNPSSHYLMMRGSDHLEPRPELPEHLRYFNQHNQSDRQAIHSTLPSYLAAVSNEISEQNILLQTLQGELRDPHKAHILPAVLSARMWIKQRNNYAQNLLERWVEPFSTWAELQSRAEDAFTPPTQHQTSSRIADPGSIVHQAWKLLISNHPHDSICGCSIDATHYDMISRFDQVDQIGEELTNQSLDTLSLGINTSWDGKHGEYAALTVFNASPYPRTAIVNTSIDLPHGVKALHVINSEGKQVAVDCLYGEREFVESNIYPVRELMGLLQGASESGHNGKTLVYAAVTEENGLTCIEAEFSSLIKPDLENLATAFNQVIALISRADPETLVRVKVFNVPSASLDVLAADLPAMGYRTYWICKSDKPEVLSEEIEEEPEDIISNQFLEIHAADAGGSLNLKDLRTGQVYHGLCQIVDVGDRGDEYNFTPPENDTEVRPTLVSTTTYKTSLYETLILSLTLDLPVSLTESRDSREESTRTHYLDVLVTLVKDVPQAEVQVYFENEALDHRLSIQFQTGLKVDSARFDGHYDILTRSIDLPEPDSTWREFPRPEVPQRSFVDVSNEQGGLMIANRGLPEVAVVRNENGEAVIDLTLLRSVDWLSRDDLWNRVGHAGPPLLTPDAQELRPYTFDFCIIPHGPDFFEAVKLAQSFQTDLDVRTSDLHPGSLPAESTMVEVSHAEFMITAIKEAEDESGWLVRGVNLGDEGISLRLKPNLLNKSAHLVNLDESLIHDLVQQPDGSVELEVPSKRIISILFKITD